MATSKTSQTIIVPSENQPAGPFTTKWQLSHAASACLVDGDMGKLVMSELPYGCKGIGTGGRVWISAVILSEWMTSILAMEQDSSNNDNKKECKPHEGRFPGSTWLGFNPFQHNHLRVLELGCGTGFVGLQVAAALTSYGVGETRRRQDYRDRNDNNEDSLIEIVLTDSDPVALENCRQNVATNQQHLQLLETNKKLSLRVEHLDWEQCSVSATSSTSTPPTNNYCCFDLILAADCVYEDNVEEFVHAVATHLSPPNKNHYGGIAKIVLRERDGSGGNLYQRALISSCEKIGLVCTRESDENKVVKALMGNLMSGIHEDFSSPNLGNDTEIATTATNETMTALDSGPKLLQQSFCLLTIMWSKQTRIKDSDKQKNTCYSRQ